jgi:hypothetical protein
MYSCVTVTLNIRRSLGLGISGFGLVLVSPLTYASADVQLNRVPNHTQKV